MMPEISIKCSCRPSFLCGLSIQTYFALGLKRGWVSTRHSPV
ncbi:hypothetical protein PM8797T_21258 [Gimesia maris DSM 8797]|nr:hypothetical protein PM8797T_21258 [Gimesia maris DSM 8797]